MSAKRAKIDGPPTADDFLALLAESHALKAALEEQDKVIETQKAALEAKDAAIETQNAALEEIDAALEEIDAAAKRRSLRTLLTLRKDDIKLSSLGSESLHVKGAHKVATATEKPFKLFDLEVEKVPLDSSSRLLLSLIEQDCDCPLKFNPLPYTCEADIAMLVNDVLLDAIAILKRVEIDIVDLTVFRERSLFSGRPDILAVRTSKHRLPLLVIEVKKPVLAGSLFDKEKSFGQAFDYEESLRARGHPLPLVVLTSLEESCVCWNSENTGATALYEEGLTTTTCPSTPQQKKESSTSTFASSPPSMLSPFLHVPSVSHNEDDESGLWFKPATQRKLNRSKDFRAHELVHVLCTALLHTTKAMRTKSERIYRLVPGSAYTFPNMLRFTTGTDRHEGLYMGKLDSMCRNAD